MLDAGLRITMCTDDPVTEGTDLVKEYELWQENYGVTIKQFYEANLNAIRTAFLSDEKKQQLFERYNSMVKDWQKANGKNDIVVHKSL